MADVSMYQRAKCTPYVEKVLANIEGTCRKYDTCITRVIWVTAAFLVWMVAAEHLISGTTVEFNGTWDTTVQASPLNIVDGHVTSRTLFRVLTVMREQCQHDDYVHAVVLGPQVTVNAKPFMYRVVRMCASGIELINPVIAFQGEQTGICKDEYEGQTRRSTRRYPIAIQSEDRAPYSLLKLDDVCGFMHALSLLDAQWSV